MSLVQRAENFLKWLTGSSLMPVKWQRWKAQPLGWKPLYNILESSDISAMVVNVHIKNLDDEIDNFMKAEEKQVSEAIQDVTGVGNTSAQAIIFWTKGK